MHSAPYSSQLLTLHENDVIYRGGTNWWCTAKVLNANAICRFVLAYSFWKIVDTLIEFVKSNVIFQYALCAW